MNKNHALLSGGDNLEYTPGSYFVDGLYLFSRANGVDEDVINIYDLVTDFQINESIYSPAMEAIFFIQDGVNLLETFEVMGDEKIQLVLEKRSLDRSEDPVKIRINLRIAGISNYVKSKPGMQFYQITCVREHIYNNHAKLLSRPFRGTLASVISTILKRDLEADVGEINISSKNTVTGIFPSMKPLHCAQWLMRNAYEDSTPYYVYETLKDGINIRSLKDLLSNDVFETYNNIPFLKNQDGTPAAYNEQKKKIIKISNETYVNKLFDIASGAYASTLHTLDLSTKEYKVTGYSYKENSTKQLNKKKPFSEKSEIKNKKLNEIHQVKNYYISLNKESFDGIAQNYHAPNNISIMEAEARRDLLGSITNQIVIYGDINLSVGNILNVIFTKPTDHESDLAEDEYTDQYNSGKYLVTDISHRFGDRYTQIVTIKKDSFNV